MTNNPGIYKITSPDNKVYIGQSKHIHIRIMGFRFVLNHHPKLSKSVLNYGWENHIKEVVHELPKDITKDILDKYEILYMEAYSDCGIELLNIKAGGWKGKAADETRKKLSEKATKQWEEYRRLGYKHPVAKEKIIKPRRVITKAKKVVCTKTGIIYDTIRAAATSIGMEGKCLSHQLNNTNPNKTSFKFL